MSQGYSGCVILMYHRIAAPGSAQELRYTCPPALFGQHMAFLRASGRPLVNLSTIDAHIREAKPLPAGAVAVTFDDGYEDNFSTAWPILKKKGIPATVFVVSGTVGDINRWDSSKGFATVRMMNREHLRELAAGGVEIGSHTRSHSRLTEASAESLRDELAGSKQDLERMLGHEVPYFAYPYGKTNSAVETAASEVGYRLACGTKDGFNTTETERFKLKRVEVFGDDTVDRLEMKIAAGHRRPGRCFRTIYHTKKLIGLA